MLTRGLLSLRTIASLLNCAFDIADDSDLSNTDSNATFYSLDQPLDSVLCESDVADSSFSSAVAATAANQATAAPTGTSISTSTSTSTCSNVDSSASTSAGTAAAPAISTRADVDLPALLQYLSTLSDPHPPSGSSQVHREECVVELHASSQPRELFWSLLLEADEDERALRTYLHDGVLLEIWHLSHSKALYCAGALIAVRSEVDAVEIKNIVIAEHFRRHVIAHAALRELVRVVGAREKVVAPLLASDDGAAIKRVTVGTADCDTAALRLYRRAGFVECGRRVGFFADYQPPVVDSESGQRARDMVLLSQPVAGPN